MLYFTLQKFCERLIVTVVSSRFSVHDDAACKYLKLSASFCPEQVALGRGVLTDIFNCSDSTRQTRHVQIRNDNQMTSSSLPDTC